MSLVTKYIRLATFGRLPDRFLTVQVQKNPAPGAPENEMGQLYFLVEIKNPWFSASQIGQSLISTFSREYFRGQNTSDFVNFEQAVKKTNETLAQITQSGETDWIGNLNAIIALVNGPEINLTATGKTHLFLWRDDHLSQISAAEKDNEPHPLKTFGDITAGSLKKHDRILLANAELLNSLSLEKIKQILGEAVIEENIIQLSRELRRQKIKNVNAILLETLDEEALAEQLIGEKQAEVIYLDQPVSSLTLFKSGIKFTREKILPKLVRFSFQMFIAGKKFAKFSREKIYPLLKKTALVVYNQSRPLIKTGQQKFKNLEKRFPALKKLTNKKEVLMEELGEEIDKIGLNVHHYALRPNRRLPKLFAKLKLYLLSTWLTLYNAFLLSLKKENRGLLYISLAVILLAGIIIFGFVRSNRKNKNEIIRTGEQSLIQAKESNETARSAEKSGDGERAKKMWHQTVTNALLAKKTPAWEDEAEKILNEAENNLDRLTGTKRLPNRESIITFPGKVDRIFNFQGTIYALDKKANQITSASLIIRQPVRMAKITEGENIFEAVLLEDDKTLLILTQKGAQELNLLTKTLSSAKVATGANWEQAEAISLYANTLYLLDPNQNQIWKYNRVNGVWEKGSSYNTRRIDLKKAISLSVDGFVWLLKDNGEVLKISKSERQDFKLEGLPTPMDKITKPLKLVTDADTNLAWLLDAGDNRIIEFDKTSGKFTRQFGLPHNLSEPRDLLVNPKSQEIFLLAENKVYEFEIQ